MKLQHWNSVTVLPILEGSAMQVKRPPNKKYKLFGGSSNPYIWIMHLDVCLEFYFKAESRQTAEYTVKIHM